MSIAADASGVFDWESVSGFRVVVAPPDSDAGMRDTHAPRPPSGPRSVPAWGWIMLWLASTAGASLTGYVAGLILSAAGG